MANHRTPDGVTPRYTALDSPVRTSRTVLLSPRATSAWTYGPAEPAIPAPRTATPAWLPRVADAPAGVTSPTRTTASRPMTVVPAQRRPAPVSPPHAWPAPVEPVSPPAPTTDVVDVAGRSAPDDIAARATTTLIPSSPGARRAAGPVFVDGSGRRARRFKGVAAAAAALAAGYVGVVVTGALAGATGPAAGTDPVASGASLAPALPATPAIVPTPVVAKPSDVTTKPARPTTTVKKKTTARAAPRTVAPKVVTPPVPAPVAPAPVAPAPVVPAPVAPAAPVTPPAVGDPTPKTGNDQDAVPSQQQPAPRDRDAATAPKTV